MPSRLYYDEGVAPMAELTVLDEKLAPTTTLHGVLVDVVAVRRRDLGHFAPFAD